MDFVDEDNGAQAAAGALLGFRHHFFNFLDAAQDGAEGDEFAFREAGNHPRECGFAAAGRSPEQHGAKIVGFDLHAQGFPGAEQFFLADELVESARAHAFGERLQSCGGFWLGE